MRGNDRPYGSSPLRPLERKTKQNKKQQQQKKERKERRRSSLRKKKDEKFNAAMRKWQMLAANKVKMSGSEKKKLARTRNIYDFSSIKRATRKFHVRWSRAKQWQRNAQNLHVQSFFSLLNSFPPPPPLYKTSSDH